MWDVERRWVPKGIHKRIIRSRRSSKKVRRLRNLGNDTRGMDGECV
jgi:hypothetical protein